MGSNVWAQLKHASWKYQVCACQTYFYCQNQCASLSDLWSWIYLSLLPWARKTRRPHCHRHWPSSLQRCLLLYQQSGSSARSSANFALLPSHLAVWPISARPFQPSQVLARSQWFPLEYYWSWYSYWWHSWTLSRSWCLRLSSGEPRSELADPAGGSAVAPPISAIEFSSLLIKWFYLFIHKPYIN